MSLTPVAAGYIRKNRADCSDAEIRRALKEQGFSDEALDEAFAAAGERSGAPRPQRGRRALVWVLAAFSALCFLASIALFVRNVSRAGGLR